jgi:signal transduction histidine kinase
MERATILIVDDEPINISVLSDLLKPFYQIRGEPSGSAALRAVKVVPVPDLILLDVMMPQMDGYEVMNRLREQPETCEIPVIFVTALDDIDDEKKGFSLGAVDYIAKPLRPAIVLARVQTQLELKQIRDELKQQNQKLADKIAQLERSEDARESLFHMIVHDLKSPLSGIIGYLSLVEGYTSTFQENIRHYLSNIEISSVSLMDMINNLLDLHRFENNESMLQTEEIELNPLVEEAVRCLGPLLSWHSLDLQLPVEEVRFVGDRDMLRRLLINLLSNAQRYSASHTTITVRASQQDSAVQIAVQDQGVGIPPEFQSKVFQKFGSLNTLNPKKGRSTGLGLPFCKFAVEAHQGKLTLESEVGKGSCFTIHLPLDTV